MTNNLFRVIKSSDLDEILRDHNDNIVIVMYSSKTCGPCMNIKPRFCAMAKEHADCFFVYIDIYNFDDPKRKYLANLKGTPKFGFYFADTEITEVLGPNDKLLTDTLVAIKNRYETIRKEVEKQNAYLNYRKQQAENQQVPAGTTSLQQIVSAPPSIQVAPTPVNNVHPVNQQPQNHIVSPQEYQPPIQQTQAQVLPQVGRVLPEQPPRPQPDSLMEKKMELMKALYHLGQQGAPVSRQFTLHDRLEDMVAEYHRLTDPRSQQSQQSTPKNQQNQQTTVAIEMSQHSQESSPKEVAEDDAEKQRKIEQIKKEQEIRRIQELEHLRRIATMQNMQKLKQIKAMKQARQQEEEREKRKEK